MEREGRLVGCYRILVRTRSENDCLFIIRQNDNDVFLCIPTFLFVDRFSSAAFSQAAQPSDIYAECWNLPGFQCGVGWKRNDSCRQAGNILRMALKFENKDVTLGIATVRPTHPTVLDGTRNDHAVALSPSLVTRNPATYLFPPVSCPDRRRLLPYLSLPEAHDSFCWLNMTMEN